MKVYSAIRPSGQLTIGNYFGAIKQWKEMEEKHSCVFAVADYHAITTDFEPQKIKEYRRDYLSWFIAAGLDPDKSILFINSDNPDHTELAWILNSIASESQLKRMTQYKDKKEKEKTITAGLLNYPILQAADILLYSTNLVPVGEDQTQHVEFARRLARKFNNRFKEVFVEPKAKLVKAGGRIMSLSDPTSKMSKSGPQKSKINLADKPKKAQDKIISAVTDSGEEVKFDIKSKPAISNLVGIYHLITGKKMEEIESDYKGKGYREFKKDLGGEVAKFLEKIQEKREKILEESSIEEIKKEGLDKTRRISEEKLTQAKKAIGLA